MNDHDTLTRSLTRVRNVSLFAAIIAGALCAVGYFLDARAFFAGYLAGWLFWLGVTLGCLAFMMIHAQTGGAWGVVLRPVIESANDVLPLVVVAFVPLLFGMHELYVWSDAEHVALDETLLAKSQYLNVNAYLVRSAAYLAIWLLIGWAMASRRPTDEPHAAAALERRRRIVSGPGLVLYGFTITLASIDWVMSIEPHWYSTMYGTIYMASQATAGLALAIVITALVALHPPWDAIAHPARFRDLGSLLLTAVAFWSYVVFMQFLLIWSANLPEEVTFFLTRSRGGWPIVAWGMVLLGMVVPIAALLMRRVKRNRFALAAVAASTLAGLLLHWYWLVAPPFGDVGYAAWQALAAFVAIGGFWLAMFAARLAVRSGWPIGQYALQGNEDERPRYEAA